MTNRLFLCRFVFLILSVLVLLDHSVEAGDKQFLEPRDSKYSERVAKNRKFLTTEGRNSLQKELQLRSRQLLEKENQNERQERKSQQKERQQERRDQVVNSGAPTLKVLVVLLQWKNHPTRNAAIPRETYDKLFNGSGRDDNLYPGGTVKEYFETMSYGDFKIEFEVTDWIMTDYTEQQFTADGTQGRTQELQKAFEPALQYLDDDFLTFRDFDNDFDRRIDSTVFLHSGYDGAVGGTDCETGKTAQQRVASHARTGADMTEWSSRSGHKLGAYAVAPAFRGSCDLQIGQIGTIVHELIHPFGIPDLYDMDGDYTTGHGGGIARFGVMASPSGNGVDLSWPGHISAWTRESLGWIEPTVIDTDGFYDLRPVEQHPDMYKITKGFSNKEYLLIENRQPIAGDFDERFFNPGGIIIYHIDENVWDLFDNGGNTGNFPRGGPFQNDWPGNGKHYPVALLQADGSYELEQGINGGTSEDIWNDPSQVLGPGNGEKVASKANYPNTDSYAFGNIQTTGITIKNFQMKAGSTMSFQVCGLSGGACTDDAPVNPAPAPETNTPTVTPKIPETSSPTEEPLVPETSSPTVEAQIPDIGQDTSPPTNTPTESPTKSPTRSPTNPPTETLVLEELENGNCEIASDALGLDGSPRGISNILNGTIGETCYGEDQEGVWYLIDAGSVPAGEILQANTCFSETNAMNKISVFKGGDCATIECVETNKIGCKNGQMGHVVYWVAEPEENYYLFTHSIEDEIVDINTLGDGSLLLDVISFPPVENDNCVSAIDAPTDGSVVSDSTEGAKPESDLGSSLTCGIESAGVWYKVVGTGNNLRATTCLPGTESPTQIHVFSGKCDALSCISVEANNYAVCDDFAIATFSATVNWQTEKDVEYFILVGSRDGTVGSFEMSVSEFTPALNNQCPTAVSIDIPETQVVFPGSTEDATNDFPYGEYCGAPLDTAGVWYTLEGTGDGLSVSTCGQNDYNSAISVFTGSDCGELECLTGIATRDPSCNYEGVTAAWLSETNQTYYVYVHGTAQNSYGRFELEAKSFETTENNEFCNEAIPITDREVYIRGSTLVSNHAAPTNVCGAEIVHPGLWYTFEGTGYPYYVSACPENDDVEISVSFFAGDTCGEMTCVSEGSATFTQEQCYNPPTSNTDPLTSNSTADNETTINATRFLQQQAWKNYTTLNSEIGVTYYIFVHEEVPSDSNYTEVSSSSGFDLILLSGAPPPTASPTQGPEEDNKGKNIKKSRKGMFGLGRKKLLYIFIGSGILLLIIFLTPCWIFRKKLFSCCYKKSDDDEPDDDDLDMEEAPFTDERPSRRNKKKESAVASKEDNTGLLDDSPKKHRWQTLSNRK